MNFIRQTICAGGMLALLAQPLRARADVPTNSAPDFREVYELVAKHLAGMNDADLNHAAVQGLLEQLRDKVSLVTPNGSTNALSTSEALTQSVLFDGRIAYLRVGRVEAPLAAQVTEACKKFSATNHLQGVVLDLRFASGQDYAAAAATADIFLSKEKPLLDWGQGSAKSKDKTNAVTLPVVILVNHETVAAAEALAAILRQDDRGIVLGATTAGGAAMSRDFPLKNGTMLRIAVAPVKLGDGEALSTRGIKPDIQVQVKPEDEKMYFANAYQEITPAATLVASLNPTNSTRAARTHQVTEADLIRERKEHPGVELEEPPEDKNASAAPPKPVVHDPVLGRALDLLKGIAALNHTS